MGWGEEDSTGCTPSPTSHDPSGQAMLGPWKDLQIKA